MTDDTDTHYRRLIVAAKNWNFSIIFGVHSIWGFGAAFISPVALLPVFLQELGASNVVIGLIPALQMFCMTAPQIFAAQLTGPLPVKKNVFTFVHYPSALALGVLALATWQWGKSEPSLVVFITLVCLSVHGLGLSFAIPMWMNLVAKLLPPESLGRHFGLIFFGGGITGGIGAFLAKWLNETSEFPDGFAIGFIIACVFTGVGVTSFFFLKEPPHPEPAPKKSLIQFLKALKNDLAGKTDYIYYLSSLICSALAGMAIPFYAVSAREEFGLGVEVGATFTLLLILSQVVGAPVAGVVGDRIGFRSLAFIPPLLSIVAALLALFGGHAWCFYLIFIVGGLAASADSVATINLPIEFCPNTDKTSFLAVRGTVISPVQALAPILGGVMADHFEGRFSIPFTGAVIFQAAALVILLFFVGEPRKTDSAGNQD